PDVKLPAFALIIDLKPEDEDFHQRLKVAFQSFIGLANLGAAQQKAPPLELGSESFEGVTIATAKFMPPKTDPSEKEPVHGRHNPPQPTPRRPCGWRPFSPWPPASAWPATWFIP